MIEVFKTNVTDTTHANLLLHQIHEVFSDYEANFDLEDCDRILRVKSDNLINITGLIWLLAKWGIHAQVLPDGWPLEPLSRESA